MWEVREKRRGLTEKAERKEKNPFQRKSHGPSTRPRYLTVTCWAGSAVMYLG